jgi:hypothetical protein
MAELCLTEKAIAVFRRNFQAAPEQGSQIYIRSLIYSDNFLMNLKPFSLCRHSLANPIISRKVNLMKKILQALFLLAIFAAVPSLAFAQESRETRKTTPLNQGGEIRLDTFKGSVTVTAWDRQEVEIYAKIEADGEAPEQKRLVQETEVTIDASADSVRIQSNYDKVQRRQQSGDSDESSYTLPLIHYTLKVPRSARVSITDHKSKIGVSDLQAELRINTHKGSVTIARQNGAVSLDTHKGDARVEFLSFNKESKFDTHKGEIEIVIPGRSGFDLDSDIGKGGNLDSTYDLSGLRKQDKRESQYKGSVNGGGPLLRMNSHKGQIRLRQS